MLAIVRFASCVYNNIFVIYKFVKPKQSKTWERGWEDTTPSRWQVFIPTAVLCKIGKIAGFVECPRARSLSLRQWDRSLRRQECQRYLSKITSLQSRLGCRVIGLPQVLSGPETITTCHLRHFLHVTHVVVVCYSYGRHSVLWSWLLRPKASQEHNSLYSWRCGLCSSRLIVDWFGFHVMLSCDLLLCK